MSWSRTAVYQRYIYKWTVRESHRTGALLSPDDRVRAAQLLAWRIFVTSLTQARPYGNVEVADLNVTPALVRQVVAHIRSGGTYAGYRENDLVQDVLQRTFVVSPTADGSIRSTAKPYTFRHKSFFEFLLAAYVVGELSRTDTKVDATAPLLEAPFPDAVILFIRESLGNLQHGDRVAAARSLDEVLRLDHVPGSNQSSHELSSSSQLEMARQQAGNLLPLVASEDRIPSLTHQALSEPSLLVRRGIAVGLALHRGDPVPLEDFVTLMADERAGSSALSAHVGYNRIYYGDQKQTEDWSDDGSPRCTAFFARTYNQLADRKKYEAMWSMTIFSLRWLLTSERDIGDVEYVRERLIGASRVCKEVLEDREASLTERTQADLLLRTVEA